MPLLCRTAGPGDILRGPPGHRARGLGRGHLALVAVSHRLGDNTNDNLSLPGTDSQRATDVLASSFPQQANGTSPIVIHGPSGKLTDSRYATAVNEAAAGVAKEPNVAGVVNPLTPQGAVCWFRP